MITRERLVEIASLAIDGLRADDEETALEYFTDVIELTTEEREFFGIPIEDKEDEEDDSISIHNGYYIRQYKK